MEVRKEMFTKDDKIFIGYTKAELKEHDRLNILSQKAIQLLTVIALDERTPTEYAKTIVELICPDSKEKELYLHGANK